MTELEIAERLLSCFGKNYKPTSICLFEWYYRKTPTGNTLKCFYISKVLKSNHGGNTRNFLGFYFRILKKSADVISNHKFGNAGQVLHYKFKRLTDNTFQLQNVRILAKR